MPKQKLELTWVGKGQDPEVEPRILLHDPSKDYGDPLAENMLIHGDNLLALKALEQDYTGCIKCIYIDPPYNTGEAFEHYDDNLEHSIWLGLMRSRLAILKNLLSEDGTIWIQIDDEEQAYLKVLCDEIFGRSNFINMVSVNMKNVAGASGGGEDKRLKKNCEFLLVYAKNYDLLPLFNGPYQYTEMSDLIQQYKDERKSWKYTTVLLNPGEKEYVGSTVDGDGNEIKVYLRKNPEMMSIRQVAKRDGITEKEVYKKYGIDIFRTTNAQTSIRTRIINYRKEMNISESVLSIEYIPKTGKNKGTVYEQFYKDDNCNLFVWLRDTSEVIDGELYKKDLQGTYWDMNAWMKNVAKEGGVSFPKGKKPEQLVRQILEMTTNPGDTLYKFDSNTERIFAMVLENDAEVLKWMRPSPKQFNIYYGPGGYSRYEPDFVVETENEIFMVETKAQKDLKDADVLEKAKAATVYCEAASTWNADHAGKPWHYALVSHDEVRINSGFKYLMENRVPPEQLHFEL